MKHLEHSKELFKHYLQHYCSSLRLCPLFSQGFLMRKHYFNDPESGFFRKIKRQVQPRNPLTGKKGARQIRKHKCQLPDGW